MPWKETKDPYKIWISEVILQQTRVDQGTPFYTKFVEKFPDVKSLAKAEEDEVLKCWQGLGYYSRARNLHFSAKKIMKDYGGRFPRDYNDIIGLKGIGSYTAAAIASFAFGLPHAVVDGNVKRVVARYFAIIENVQGPKVHKRIQHITDDIIRCTDPAAFNQAIMDFGALHCMPAKPKCEQCTLNSTCKAFQKGLVEKLPVVRKTIKRTKRYFHYFMVEQNGSIHIEKRTQKDIWSGLYQLKLFEGHDENPLGLKTLQQLFDFNPEVKGVSKTYKHKLSHQDLFIRFYRISVHEKSDNLSSYNLVDKRNLRNFAFPKIIDRYLEENSIYL